VVKKHVDDLIEIARYCRAGAGQYKTDHPITNHQFFVELKAPAVLELGWIDSSAGFKVS
jgi:hypothetical protein